MRLITDEQHAQIMEALNSCSGNCEHLHHAKKDRHGIGEGCPVEVRYSEALNTLQALPDVEVVAWRTMESDEKKPKRLDEWFYAENKAYTEVHKFKWMPLYATKETP